MTFLTAVTKRLTPLFNTSNLHQIFMLPLVLDKGLWRPLETLLPKGIPLKIKTTFNDTICEIETEAYPSQTPLYTHIDFLQPVREPLKQWQRPQLPPLSVFLKRINWCLEKKIPYLWGGNAPLGTHSLRKLYRNHSPLNQVDIQTQKILLLQGLDCSGLIYWATRGATSRNTSQLIREGTGVNIEGLSSREIALQLSPGRIIVWKGHVLISTQGGIVDSSPEKGVSFTPTQQKIEEIRTEREPLNEWPLEQNPLRPGFVIRDLYP